MITQYWVKPHKEEAFRREGRIRGELFRLREQVHASLPEDWQRWRQLIRMVHGRKHYLIWEGIDKGTFQHGMLLELKHYQRSRARERAAALMHVNLPRYPWNPSGMAMMRMYTKSLIFSLPIQKLDMVYTHTLERRFYDNDSLCRTASEKQNEAT